MDFDCCGCRGKPKSAHKRVADNGPIGQAGQDGSQCGIGVVFRMDTHGALVVDSLVQGGPAWDSAANGGLQVGDVLQTVDGKNVYRWSVQLLAPLLLGPEGTTVRLGVQRSIKANGDSNGTAAQPQSNGSTDTNVLRSFTIDIQRKRFSPPPEPYSASRPPIVDARRGIGQQSTQKGAGAQTNGFTAA